ncbi:MAG: zinc dependent phospholipase C family protein [Chitinophagaceae bacterium]
MKKVLFLLIALLWAAPCFCWGFFGHRKINQLSVFLLPPEMMVFFKKHISYLTEHAVDPDKRRYALPEEGQRHYIDIDHYGNFPYTALPRNWDTAVAKFSEDTLRTYGIVPWWVQTMQFRLTKAFREKDAKRILKLAAEIGHYIADAHVPLHACSNHNGQFTNQRGIHGFWESRIPELLAESSFRFWMPKAEYISNPGNWIWERVLESAAAADTVLTFEKKLAEQFPPDKKYAFEARNGVITRSYSSAYTIAYHNKLNGMVERRMRQSIHTTASFWYTAWVDAGQPNLSKLLETSIDSADIKEMELLNDAWKKGKAFGKICD